MEIDIYLPNYSIGFEYQGEHHFGIPHFLRNEKIIELRKIKDKEKINYVKNMELH